MDRKLFLSLGAAALCSGCASIPDTASSTERIDETPAAIQGGAPDSTHRAVVAFSKGVEECSATVIGREDGKGFALTAAHCCGALPLDMAHVDVGGGVVVTHLAMDRAYDGRDHDFCLLTFTGPPGVIGALSVLPPLTPAEDHLASGDSLELVGYGDVAAVEGGAMDGGPSHLRRSIVLPISSVDALAVHYAEDEGGPCAGDSGGPALVMVNGVEKVAAVISRGTEDCKGEGTSGRVSAVYDDFIVPYLAGQPQKISCSACAAGAASSVGACADARLTCNDDPSCAALARCHGQCSTSACLEACDSQHPAGLARYAAIKACVCGAPCADACAGDGLCLPDPDPPPGCALGLHARGDGLLFPPILAVLGALVIRRRRSPRGGNGEDEPGSAHR